MAEKESLQRRHSGREAFTNRSSSVPLSRPAAMAQRWRGISCPTVGSFMVANRFEEVLAGVVPSDLPLEQFCSLTEDLLRTKFNVDNPEKISHVMTVVKLARELENSYQVERTVSSPTISSPKPCEYDDLLSLFPRRPHPLARQTSEDVRHRRESFVGYPHTPCSPSQGESSNLLRMRTSLMGQSAPSLTASIVKDLGPQRRVSRAARKNMVVNTSPTLLRCHSPVSQALPSENFRNVPPVQHLACAPLKRGDGRRWSLASLPSSGYGTNTPGSSNVSSQCSSQEKLHLLSHVNADDIHPLHHHFSSNESNPGLEEDGRHSPVVRPRSRSLSLAWLCLAPLDPLRSPGIDNDVILMNNIYKERFPKATQQMEEKLQQFVTDHKDYDASGLLDAVARFVHHQVVQMAEDCLHQSQNKLITSHYFFEMTENLERLLNECQVKSPEAAQHLKVLIRKLLVTISRPARLLECLEFDPEEFYKLLEAAEGQAKIQQGVTSDIPQYIINKLGLNRDPLAELSKDLSTDVEEFQEPDPFQAKEIFPKSKPPVESDFETVKLISNGAYGAVYLVRHLKTRMRFAMKKINKQNLVLRNQVEQVYAERDIMSFTDNPFVVSMFCSFETKKHLCMVMEYVEGGDCATLLKNMGPLPVDMARFYFAETVLAVEYLHSFGIVHRDLKPDNLLVTSMGHIKLTDFGLSKVGLMNLATNLYEGYLDRETKQFTDKQVYGTPEYIAPEVILRQGYGKPVDWWSMGVILYEFLIGCVPFFGDTPEELFAHVINDELEWPDQNDYPLPDDAKDIILQLLQQNPLDRLGTGSAHEVKDHCFFYEINWNTLLRQKAEFVPQLESEDDTSYFDTRADRYCHEVEDSEDMEEQDESAVFGSFSSCSPRFRKVYSRVEKELEEEHMLQHSKDEYRKSYSRSDSNNSDHSESPSSQMGSLAETPEDGLSRDIFLSFDTSGKSTSLSFLEGEFDRSICVLRKTHHGSKDSLPRFSISTDCDKSEEFKELSPVEETDAKISPKSIKASSPIPVSARISIPPVSPISKHTARSVIKSASVSGLSLIIPADEFGPPPIGSPGGSSTSSRDASPSRELSPLVTQLKPPIIIRKGPRGFGFTVRAIRVYYGDSDVYTVHHLVMAVDDNSPSFEAGLRPGDLITHLNGEPIQGLLHHQVLQLILSGGDRIHIRTIPLDNTTIKTGGRKRNPTAIKMAKRPLAARRRTGQAKRDGHSDKKRRASLLRRLSNKRASAEIHQSVSGSSPVLTPSRSFQSLTRTLTSADSLPASPTRLKSPRSPPTARFCTQSDSPHSTGNSSQSSSPSSSVPNSPAGSTHLPHFPRPSSLHGLKHKLTQTFHSPRRKSVGHIPLSPLARTPSPSPIASTSPTRSPSPLAFPVCHHPPSGCQALKAAPVSPLSATICSSAKKSFMRPKSAEPSSPLLRRALSPDRLHPKSAEAKAKRESFSGQASPLALSSSPSSTRSYLSSGSISTSKLCMSSPHSSVSSHSSGIASKSLVDLPDSSVKDSSFQRSSLDSTPKFRPESRAGQPWHSISHLRRKGEKPVKSLVFSTVETEYIGNVSSEIPSSRSGEVVSVSVIKAKPVTPDIEITNCPSTVVEPRAISSNVLPRKEIVVRPRSESEPVPFTHFSDQVNSRMMQDKVKDQSSVTSTKSSLPTFSDLTDSKCIAKGQMDQPSTEVKTGVKAVKCNSVIGSEPAKPKAQPLEKVNVLEPSGSKILDPVKSNVTMDSVKNRTLEPVKNNMLEAVKGNVSVEEAKNVVPEQFKNTTSELVKSKDSETVKSDAQVAVKNEVLESVKANVGDTVKTSLQQQSKDASSNELPPKKLVEKALVAGPTVEKSKVTCGSDGKFTSTAEITIKPNMQEKNRAVSPDTTNKSVPNVTAKGNVAKVKSPPADKKK